MAATPVEPASVPGNPADYLHLLTTGRLIDLAGRALRLVDYPWCGQLRTSGAICHLCSGPPWATTPRPATSCRRPSGRVPSTSLAQGWHRQRATAAAHVDDHRAATGDLTAPAPWPPRPHGRRVPEPMGVYVRELWLETAADQRRSAGEHGAPGRERAAVGAYRQQR